MPEIVGVAGLKCEHVQDVTVSVKHMSPNTLNVWLSKLVCEVAKQNGERYPSNLLYLLVCAINCYLRETGREDALNFINKAHKRKVNCYLMVVIEMSNL